MRAIRQLQELTQHELADLTGIAQSTISAIESDHLELGIKRAKQLARALKVHPAVFLFSDWDQAAEELHKSCGQSSEPLEVASLTRAKSNAVRDLGGARTHGG